MAPIRVGFIGLSSGQSWAVWAHLPYLKNTSKYEIVALCNSSVESAQAAIKAHGLASSVKAYGSSEDLAADSNVQLVVCCIRVDKHYDTVMPALKAGKDVFCEWPLAKDSMQAEEMTALAKDKGVRTFVGLQSPFSPLLQKIKQIIDSEKVGKVLSSTLYGTPTFFGATQLEATAYMEDIKVGGNMVSIYAMHSLESLQFVLGPLSSFTSHLAISYPEVQLVNYSGEPTKRMPRTVHDQVMIQGTLASGAVLSYHLRGGPAFDKAEGATWWIYGTNGQIKVTVSDSFFQITDDNAKVELFDHTSKSTEVVVVDKDAFSDMPVLYARNIARLYEAFADGKGESEGVRGFEHALRRHRFIDEVYAKAGVR